MEFLKKNISFCVVFGMLLLSDSSFGETLTPPTRINHRTCTEHIGLLVNGVSNSGIGVSEARKVILEARKFDPAKTSYKVDKVTAAWSNQYNPMARGGADANWVDGLPGPSHPLNSVFFKNGEYNTSKFLSAAEIKANVEKLTKAELDSLPSIRKYDLMVGDFNMKATKEQIKEFGTERKPSPEGWEGFCYPMRFIGSACPVPTKNVVRKIPGTSKSVTLKPYDIATLGAVNWNGTELYARMGDVGRGSRDRDPPNFGAFFVMLQTHRIMKETHPKAPYASIFDVEPNAEIWNESLQNWEASFTAASRITDAEKISWNAPAKTVEWVDASIDVELSAEAGITNSLTRNTVANGGGMNSEHYEGRIFLDNKGQVVGGAWLEDQNRSFPDLVGFANGRGIGARYVRHDQVVKLFRDSTKETDRVIPGE